ncbi:MAG: nitroreductase family protein [Flavobacteriales bacterium]|nr:nitroreductase family protein [Flavobacteriales bacterium]
METTDFIPYRFDEVPEDELRQWVNQLYKKLNGRRTVREFSDKMVSIEVMEKLILTAGTAPSGANKQPWTFCAVNNAELKRKIKEAAEKEEFENYHGRMSEEWLKDLEQFGTNWQKPFLEIAPWLIIVFRKSYDFDGIKKSKNYYVQESVGIACGMLITAIHNAGLVCLTHTPSPMNFLSQVLERPENEKPFLLIPVGYPAINATVPNIKRKALNEISQFYL